MADDFIPPKPIDVTKFRLPEPWTDARREAVKARIKQIRERWPDPEVSDMRLLLRGYFEWIQEKYGD